MKVGPHVKRLKIGESPRGSNTFHYILADFFFLLLFVSKTASAGIAAFTALDGVQDIPAED